MKWNNEQQLAIQSVGQNILVSASAGAGKTAVLVERLVKRCLQDKISLDRILAMTFTEAAANEMKKRLSKRLNEEALSPTSDHEYIQKQLVLLQDAKISTIHSFCLDLIKKHADAIGLDPSFVNNILEDGPCNKAKDDAFFSCLKKWSITNKDMTSLLTQYFSARSEDFEEFKKCVFQIVAAASSSSDVVAWFENAKRNTQTITSQADLPNDLFETFMSSCSLDYLTQKQSLEQIIEILERTDPKNEKINKTIELKLHFLKDVERALSTQDINDFVICFRRYLTKPTAPNGKNEEYTAARKILTAHATKCIAKYPDFDTLRNDSNKMSEFAHALLDFSLDVYFEFLNYKNQLGGINFDDMERYAYEILLADNMRIAQLLKEDFDEILVDEFQDTSELQNEIICFISNGRNVFRVGDVKQSIYRFRKAKPDIMRSLMQDSSVQQISLSYNYRSNHSIVDYTNTLFSRCMNVEGCKDTYREVDHVQAGTDRQKEVDSPVEFYALYTDDIEQEFSNKQAKAHFIAQKILQMKEETEFKKFSDYVILAKSHGDKNLFKQVFSEYNIPHSIDAKEGFYQSNCALIVVSMLRLIVEINEISLTAVLTSPLYEMSDNDLSSLKIQYKSILDGCIQTKHPILNNINRCRDIYKKEGLLALLNEISLINQFVEAKLDIQQKTNFDFLFQKATNFTTKSSSLFEFLEQIDLSLDERSNESVALGPEEDVVRAITIHHSKGLQYKVVFYWSTTSNKLQDKSDSILTDSDYGIGLYAFELPTRTRRSTFQRIAIEHKINCEDLEEAIRVLYVALTRAETKLILVDNLKNEIIPQKIELSLLNQRKGMTHLVLSALSNYRNFSIHHVTDLELNYRYHKKISQAHTLSRYSFDNQAISTLSPSSTENYFIPQLNFHKQTQLRGTTIHQMIEKLPNRIWTKDDFDDSLSNVDVEKCIRFSESDIYKKCLQMDIKKEFSFSILDDNQLIQGTFDFIAISNQEVILIDFKSDRNCTKEMLIKRYQSQIDLYKKACGQCFPSLPINAYLYSFDLEELITI